MTEISEAASIQSTAAPGFGSLASGVAVTFATRLVIVACTLGASIVVARWLGPEGTGALAVLNVIAALSLQLGSAGIPSATTYFVAKDRAVVARVWANGLLFSFAAGSLIALLVVALANLWPSLFNGVPPRLVTVVAVSIPFQVLTLLGLNLLLAIDRMRLMNLLYAMTAFLIFLNAAILLIVWRRDLTTLVWFNQGATVAM